MENAGRENIGFGGLTRECPPVLKFKRKAQRLAFLAPPRAIVTESNEVVVLLLVEAEANLFEEHGAGRIRLFLHWGRCGLPLWCDEEIASREIHPIGKGRYVVCKSIFPETTGEHGITAFAQFSDSSDRQWLGNTSDSDAKFLIGDCRPGCSMSRGCDRLSRELQLESRILQSLSDYSTFCDLIFDVVRSGERRALTRLLFLQTKNNVLRRQLLSHYYQRTLDDLAASKVPFHRGRLAIVAAVLQNLGIGEIVLVTPEGPHAQAGGLAQVITGLTKSLSAQGLNITLITPLYERDAGNKHKSAAEIITEGVDLCGRRAPLRYLGEIKVGLGSTKSRESGALVRPREIVTADVYCAERRNVRVFFVRQPILCDRIYPEVWADEMLRRSVFFSRAALEIVAAGFGEMSPHVVMTHDWFTALVPILLKTHSRYSGAQFDGIQAVHMLHNCGRDYQGRIPFAQWDQELWPMLDLADEHRPGLSDPSDPGVMNLTRGALYHADRLVTVSRTYAEELLTNAHGEGLHELLRKKEGFIFGISNGIDLESLREKAWGRPDDRGALSTVEDVDLKRNGPDPRNSEQKARLGRSRQRRIWEDPGIACDVTAYKRKAKAVLQEMMGLSRNPESILISFVGRLAEQKGISLLLEKQNGETILETLLSTEQDIQIVVAGPIATGDSLARELETSVISLASRFPSQIAGRFQFLEHGQSIRVLSGSDLVLMPSRYEPGGIVQLEALAVGTPVVARRVGGIAATLVDYTANSRQGNAFLFDDYTPNALLVALASALDVLRDPEQYIQIVRQAASAMHDWSERTSKYIALLQQAGGVFEEGNMFEHLKGNAKLISAISPQRRRSP